MGNRLRALKSALLVAMLTGRVFRVRWVDPYPLDTLVRPVAIDWRERASLIGRSDGAVATFCLPFGAGEAPRNCGQHLRNAEASDLRSEYDGFRTLEMHMFTDLHIYLATNPHYRDALSRLEPSCPKRAGCLYRFLFSPQPAVQKELDAVMPPPRGSAGHEHVAVQVRNRLWGIEASKLKGAKTSAERVVQCMGRWVPADAKLVFFTADDDNLYPAAQKEWGGRFRSAEGAVFSPWSRGGHVNASLLGVAEERAVIKAFVDWFALERAKLLVYTFGSSFGKTAAEASDSPNIDVNQTRCKADEETGGSAHAAASAPRVTYEARVPHLVGAGRSANAAKPGG